MYLHRYAKHSSTQQKLEINKEGPTVESFRKENENALRIVASSQFGDSFVGLYDMSSGSSGNVMFSSDLPMLEKKWNNSDSTGQGIQD
ncbi:hypothetical protein LWI29_017270 [Acer saccharum]|uniref:Uncharacterized protein n=1 Tax=Acer saccharum TaxID=4024 RepID=A0AA39RUI4_ACESA|nr:hypothetical protein LWI29_017270 [Acer saccharum]